MFSGSDFDRMANGCVGSLAFLFAVILIVGMGMGACVNKACHSGWRVQSPITRAAK